MSLGGAENAGSAAGSASGAASGVGSAAGAAGSVGSAAGTGSSLGSVGTGIDSFNVSQGAQGFDFGAATNSPSASVGPTTGGFMGAATEQPSWLDKALDYYKDYQKGGEQDLGSFVKNFGNNAKTYGFAGRKISDFALSGGKGGNSPPAMVTNVNYQQPENSYFARRRRA